MRIQHTDREQIEMLKNWWQEYGKGLAIAIVIGIVLGYGWHFWKAYRVSHESRASYLYQQLTSVVMKNADLKTIKPLASALMKDYTNTPYAAIASLYNAKAYVEANKLNQAIGSLKWASAHTKSQSLKTIVALRIARIQIAQGQANAALTTLKSIHNKTFEGRVQAVKADAYMALKQTKKADALYKSAANSLSQQGLTDPLTLMKFSAQ